MERYFRFCSLTLTDHTEARASQRGLKLDDIGFLIENGDQITEVGGGRVAYTLTRNGLDHLDPEERQSPEAQKALKGALVLQSDAVITAVKLHENSKGQALRKGHRKDGHPHRPRKGRRISRVITHG